MTRAKPARWGNAPLELVLTLSVTFPIAAGLYWIFEEGMEMYILTLGTAVGWPLM